MLNNTCNERCCSFDIKVTAHRRHVTAAATTGHTRAAEVSEYASGISAAATARPRHATFPKTCTSSGYSIKCGVAVNCILKVHRDSCCINGQTFKKSPGQKIHGQ